MEYFKKGEYKKYKYSKTGTSLIIKGKIADNSAISEDAAVLDVATKIINTVKAGGDLFFLNHHTYTELDYLQPRNFLTGKTYNDLNAFNLYFDAFKYNDPRFMMFATAKKYGYKIIKGSKASKIITCGSFLKDDQAGDSYVGKKILPLFNAGNMQHVPPFEQKAPKFTECMLFNSDISNIFAGYVKTFNIPVYMADSIYYRYDKKTDSIYLQEKSQYVNPGINDSAILHALADSTGGSLRLSRDYLPELNSICTEITAFLLSLEFNADHMIAIKDKAHIYDYLNQIIECDEAGAVQLMCDVVSAALLSFNYLTYGYRTNWTDIKEKFDPVKGAKFMLKHAGSMIKGRKKEKIEKIDMLKAEVFSGYERPAAEIKKARKSLKNEPVYFTAQPVPVDRIYAPKIKPVDHGTLKPKKQNPAPVPVMDDLDLYEPVDNSSAIDDLDYCPPAGDLDSFYSHIA